MDRHKSVESCRETYLKLIFSVGIWTIVSMIPNFGLSQTPTPVTIDGTLQGLAGSGNNSGAQNLPGPDITVTREMGLVRGNNLFHSFGRFNVPTDGSVTFNGPNNIDNILSRVTGNDTSTINGILASEIGGADLYLINPNGIIFGENASLDIKGSFYATTANNIELTDDKLFNTIPGSADAVLTTAQPEAFGFLGKNPPVMKLNGTIKNTAAIRIEELNSNGSDVVIIGRDAASKDGQATIQGLQIAGNLTTQGGNVTLASVDTSGKASIGTLSPKTEPKVILEEFSDQGHVTFLEGALVNTNGSFSSISDSGDGGKVVIQGGQLVFESNSLITTNPRIGGPPLPSIGTSLPTQLAVPFSGGTAGGVKIIATEILSLTKSSINTSTSLVLNPGRGGLVEIQSPEVIIKSNSSITTNANILGNAGNIEITADRKINLLDSNIFSRASSGESGSVIIKASAVELNRGKIDSNVGGEGNAGAIKLNVKELTMEHFEITNSSEQGSSQAGTILIKGFDENNSISAETILITQGSSLLTFNNDPSAQAGGQVQIDTQELALKDGGRIIATSVGAGEAGSIKINAHKSVSISGSSSSTDPISSGLQAESFGGSEGKGGSGQIEINTPKLSITDGGQITTVNNGIGLGGNVLIQGSNGNEAVNNDIIITGQHNPQTPSGIFSESKAKGPGGDITLIAQTITLRDGAATSAKSFATGDAGTITAIVTNQLVSQDSSIETSAQQADGGNIDLQAQSLIHLIDSKVSASVQGGEGRGGNISIDPEAVILQNTPITANAFGGPGGNIGITAGVFLRDQASNISASSRFDVGGKITIDSPVQQLSETLAPLPEVIIQIASLYAQRCAAQKDGHFSSFSRIHHDGLPPQADGFLTSPLQSLNSFSFKPIRTDFLRFSQGLIYPDSYMQIDIEKNSRKGENC